jgi:diguanylate cyclase
MPAGMTYLFAALGFRRIGVVAFFFVLAVLNVALGYCAALALVEPPLWNTWNIRWPRPLTAPRPDPPTEASPPPTRLQSAAAPKPAAVQPPPIQAGDLRDAPSTPPIVAGFDELPPDWLAQLAVEGIVAQTFVDATAHVLRLEVGRYREQLVIAECRTRSYAADGHITELRRLSDELRYLNQDWLDKQTAAADMLAQRAGRLGDHEQAAGILEQVLLDQASQIRTVCDSVQSLEMGSNAELAGRQLLEQIASLLTFAHSLRDRIIDLLATLIRDGRVLDTFGATMQRDPFTGLPNRIGLEAILAAWWREDTGRTRMLSAIAIDLDRFGRINQRLGTRSSDRAIVAIARLIDETLTKDRGFERLIRIGGEAFMILQGDVGPHQALTAAERLRQAIEATTFDDEGTEFDLTITCGVIEVAHTESSLDLVRRALDTLRFAKKAGRNRCALDKGDGPAMLDPPQFPVKGRVVNLRTATPTPESIAPSAQPS